MIKQKPVFKRTTENRIIGALQNIDMRFGHNGLGYVIQKTGLNPENIPRGNWFLFVNSARTMMKMYGHQGVMVSYQSKSGRLDLNAFRYITEAFNEEGGFDFDRALKKSIEERLALKGRTQRYA